MRDARKPLPVLYDEWRDCTRCSLSERRIEEGAPVVFGEGAPRGILFVGEGPGREEERAGRPFVGKSGHLLRDALRQLGLVDFFITNAVACRSCGPAYNGEGKLVLRPDFRTGIPTPIIVDKPPTAEHVNACRPRLHELIYLLDPVLIVSLGAEATRALTNKSAPITAIRGDIITIEIEGAWSVPQFTEKGRWARVVRGKLTRPTQPNKVRYSLLPVLHPAYVLRSLHDKKQGNPVQLFAQDMQRVATLYDRYMQMTFNVSPTERAMLSDDFIRELGEE